MHERCVAGFQRMRDCTDVYIPTLVGLRVQYDVPPGIAARDAELGRDALVAKAMEEWAVDSADEKFEALCGQILGEASQEEIARFTEVADTCEATDTCEAFVECLTPSLAARFGAPPPQ